MITLQHEGLKLVVAGKTSLEELQRIFQPKK
jgi:type II secretory ATPase GspE/PulE/Tfp pilus assembly ATPase PilB-like protein